VVSLGRGSQVRARWGGLECDAAGLCKMNLRMNFIPVHGLRESQVASCPEIHVSSHTVLTKSSASAAAKQHDLAGCEDYV
jgi:hypothetical protein